MALSVFCHYTAAYDIDKVRQRQSKTKSESKINSKSKTASETWALSVPYCSHATILLADNVFTSTLDQRHQLYDDTASLCTSILDF